MSTSLINKPVLLLNQNYEPMQICTARRAFILLFQGKAELIEKADGLKIHTVTKAFSLPSVVRLWQYKKIPQKKVMLTRKNIFSRDSNRCQYCGTAKGPMTIDHVISKKYGGEDSWDNLVTACSRCNSKKGNKTPEQANMKLLKKPSRPTFITFIQFNNEVSDHWRPFLFMDPVN
ncbi:MAG: HNH endonuclease [Candidatus Zixiibacteriota bacterium]|nr:MAG: HNH endonuclease [candidate division Zixibacteria bacterium]